MFLIYVRGYKIGYWLAMSTSLHSKYQENDGNFYHKLGAGTDNFKAELNKRAFHNQIMANMYTTFYF